MKKCKNKKCNVKMNEDAPDFCDIHNKSNKKRVPLSERRLHIIAEKYLKSINFSQISGLATKISEFLDYINKHKNDVL